MNNQKLIEQRDKLQQEINVLDADIALKQRERSQKQTELKNIKDQIIAFKRGDSIVSDHAVVRYLERIQKLDIGAIRDEICTEETREAVTKIGSGEIATLNKGNVPVYLYVRGGVITTVTDTSQKGKKKKKKHGPKPEIEAEEIL